MSIFRACDDGKQDEQGFPEPYSMSKVAVIALAKVQQRELEKDTARPDIIVNSVI